LTLSVISLGIVTLFGLAAALLLWVVKPLGRASRVSQALANGDLTARIDEAGPLELARLGADVNEMAAALIRRSDELNAYLGKNLETRTEELRTSEQRFRALVEHAADLITVIAANGVITYQSPSITRVLGYDPAEVIGRSCMEFSHPDDLERAAGFIADVTNSHGDVHAITVRARALDGGLATYRDHRDRPS
jgi:PAS domain S-box-containing protein